MSNNQIRDLEARLNHARGIAAASVGQLDRTENVAYRNQLAAQLHQAQREALNRVTQLAEKWETATELDTGNPSIVTKAFAAELRAALNGEKNQCQ